MTKEQIREIILNKYNGGSDLTLSEMGEALKYFTTEEIECMRFPIINHESCFRKRASEYIDVVVEDDNNF